MNWANKINWLDIKWLIPALLQAFPLSPLTTSHRSLPHQYCPTLKLCINIYQHM